MQKIVYKNANISYSSKGKGVTVVLLHGFLESSTMWKEIAKRLVKKFHVITIDLLGHGKSDCIGYVHSMELMAETVDAVLKHLKIRKPIFVGHSMGGYVALAYADKNSQKVKGLCLLNSTSREDDEHRLMARDSAMKVAKNHYESVVKVSVRGLFRKGNTTQFKTEIQEIINEAIQMSHQSYFAAQEGMKLRPNREHVLKNASFNTLMITGKHDTILSKKDQKLEAKRTQTPLIVLSEGHMSHLENKEEVIDLLITFVKNC